MKKSCTTLISVFCRNEDIGLIINVFHGIKKQGPCDSGYYMYTMQLFTILCLSIFFLFHSFCFSSQFCFWIFGFSLRTEFKYGIILSLKDSTSELKKNPSVKSLLLNQSICLEIYRLEMTIYVNYSYFCKAACLDKHFVFIMNEEDPNTRLTQSSLFVQRVSQILNLHLLMFHIRCKVFYYIADM